MVSNLGVAEKLEGDDPSVGYGIATGARSKIFVIDLDGLDAIRTFLAMGDVPRTFAVRRGPERAHLYFNAPAFRIKNSASQLAPQVDVRGDGGFVVAPGSPHKSGETYQVADNAPVADAPPWLLSWPQLRQPKQRVHESSVDEHKELEACIGARVPRDWRVARAKAWLATQPAAVSGRGGHAATMRAVSIAARENLLTDTDMILEAIEEWNARCEPPWRGAELDHKVREVLHRSTVPWNTALGLHYRLAARGLA
jgi:hypothetical protein